MIVPPWNLSSASAVFKDADGYLVSIPKCGRTWLRVFLGAYFEKLGKTPNIRHTHDLWDHRTKSRWYEQIRGKRLIPQPDRRRKPVLLVVRDPRDLLVSLYFHLTKRTEEFEGTVAELVRDPLFGIEAIVIVWNYWLREWGESLQFAIFRYEEARQNPGAAFRKLAEFFSNAPVNAAALEYALERSSFENMRKMEATGEPAAGVDAAALTPGSIHDSNSFKVRAGKVGGYREHLSDEDLRFIAEALKKLDPRTGY